MANSGDKINRCYSQEDVQQILQLAIARQADDDKEFSHEVLLEIASELDISPETLRLAEDDWVAKQGEIQHRQAFNLHRQRRFKKRAGNYFIFNTFLVFMDLLTGGGINWSLYIVLSWGLLVGLDGWNTFQTKGEDYEAAFQRWHRKHQLKSSFNNLVNKFLKATSR
ncbi:2TM domain-containing protein [Rivularia sp. UHCC 0363]|uniref:2TM domain-containing protein n=1 Tax=Rivularia sp. UHCC 0363 TaxID=3110244 RepID=UPI002B1EE2AD|nr:2TM domain-containing protein [Rivularia sp. UHCC 0363]MEA5595021.1 2TM domain-containing protein [Rivularia sp. UHCC 0363]